MNYSKQRELILKALCEMCNHPTADAVFDHVRKHLPSISLATVYRNLNQLAENGTIKRIDGLDGSVHFDHQIHEHYHFICTKCNKVYDVSNEVAPNLPEEVKAKTGLVVESYDLSLRGICPKCKKLN